MEVKIPETLNVVELETAPFKTVHEAADWARGHGVVGLMSSVDTGGKGEISISMMSIGKMLSGSAMHKSVTPAIHLAALVRLRDIIRESFVGECHPDYLKVNGRRSPENGFNSLVDIAVLYGCVAFGGIPYRSKTTLKFFRDATAPTKAYSYEVSNIEVLKGIAAPVALPSDKTSIDVGILLNGVCDVNGVPLLPKSHCPKR